MTALNGVAPAVSTETSPFLQAIVQQIRANDTFGTYRNWNDDLLLKPYVIPKKERREITLDGAVDIATMSRILAFYRAIAARIEIETGQLAQVVLDINTEGFGWAIIFSGRLILVLKTIRDAHRFGFDTIEKLNAEGEKLIQKGVELAKAHAEVCDL
ncbi:NifX-associated nitrogen fixation protein [Vacuolonema iberomarrocanum]|uniref:NifX-associated nitrogen fixation protein n=1 Tax=Vacuolonema iberomarrocanum TaxID=3454632 RepID=UPI001A0980F0|nr:NifX-associated nitrogen fixation protein [filamentous cyanobacterium LEGE 07170]